MVQFTPKRLYALQPGKSTSPAPASRRRNKILRGFWTPPGLKRFPARLAVSRAILNRMRWLDLGVIVGYLAGITWFGSRFRSSQHSLKDYFLGGRSAPWWAIALSIVSAETSTLTVIGTPALAYKGSFVFLQVVFGYLLARIVISTVFLPQYFQGHLLTAYALMERRFGPRVRKVTAGIF